MIVIVSFICYISILLPLPLCLFFTIFMTGSASVFSLSSPPSTSSIALVLVLNLDSFTTSLPSSTTFTIAFIVIII